MAVDTLEQPLGGPALFEKEGLTHISLTAVDPESPSTTLIDDPFTAVRSSIAAQPWNAYSWRSKPAHQPVEYANPSELDSTCALISRLPGLVPRQDIESARKGLHDVALGRAFIIQGGDCAESFSDATHESVLGHMSLLAREAAALSSALGGVPVLEMGRIAGQYAKPRSSPVETLPGGKGAVLTFRGENINSPDPLDREPDPGRLVLGYIHASKRMQLVTQIRHGYGVMDGDGDGDGEGHRGIPFYTCHEALHLPLEAAMTKGRYNTSATFLWVGARTAQPDGAHIEYVRGLRNPLGIKVGPTTEADELVRMLDTLCPDKQAAPWGRVTLITRLGAARAGERLPALVRAVQLSGHMPVWVCDPCHGNTETTAAGYKTRRVETMLRELQDTYAVHRRLRSHLGGIHLEQTGRAVTECLDPVRVTDPDQLPSCYETLCDPRLARDQALWLVQRFADFVQAYPA